MGEKEKVVEHPRAVKSKTGKIKSGKLSPIPIHDNRNGPRYYGKNQLKRDKKAAADKLWAEGKRQKRAKTKPKNRDTGEAIGNSAGFSVGQPS
jgi:hypothetical protein